MSEQSKAHRLRVSLQMQAREYKRRLLILSIVLTLPVAFWVSMYLTAGENPTPITVPTSSGDVEMIVPARESYPTDMGLMGITWAVAAAAFFAASGSVEKDKRLTLCGYNPWQILGARFILLTGIALLVSVIPLILFVPVLSALHPSAVWLASFLAGMVAAGIGLLVGALIPRYTEGMLTLIGILGIGMAMKGTAASFFPTYPAKQLFHTGIFAAEPLILPFVVQALLILIALVVVNIGLWSYRVRIHKW